jgi:ABC-type transporter Mla subunit MlaD
MRRTWLLVAAAAVVVIAAIVVAVVLVTRSNDESSSPSTTQWAGEVCTSLSKWRASITSLANVSGIPTQDDVRKKLTDAQVATEQLVTDLEDIADLLRRLAAILPDFQKLLNEISTTIETLQSSNVAGDSADEVKQGFENAESCQKLRSEQD